MAEKIVRASSHSAVLLQLPHVFIRTYASFGTDMKVSSDMCEHGLKRFSFLEDPVAFGNFSQWIFSGKATIFPSALSGSNLPCGFCCRFGQWTDTY